MTRNYIGMATSQHDTAIAFVNSQGEIVFAEATERYLQSKRGWGYHPDDLIRSGTLLEKYCEKGADLVIASPWTMTAKWYYRLMLSHGMPLLRKKMFRDDFEAFRTMAQTLFNTNSFVGSNLTWQYSALSPRSLVTKRTYNHHTTHAAAGCYTSPFKDAVCVIIDGFGENISTTGVFHYKDGRLLLKPLAKESMLMSLGLFYQTLCTVCGFDWKKGEEWKVMGLAPYGKLDPAIYEILRGTLDIKECRIVGTERSKKSLIKLYTMRRKHGEPALKMADMAFTGQYFFNEMVFKLLNNVYKMGISDNLVLGGGCALNSSCSGLILDNTPFKQLHVFCAPADDGNAVGAALLAYYDDNPAAVGRAKVASPFLGSKMSLETLDYVERFGGLKNTLPAGQNVCQRAAELLSAGKIIGWVQGRAEFGPRALGNRSILADPRDPDIKEKLNSRVKFREEFRPFAPSILHEYGPAYFEHYQQSPYMERTLNYRSEVKEKIPGVVHMNDSGRLQTVKREWNEKYYDLIAAFNTLTGVPLLLNTSFNVMGKPLIHSVEDAIAVFFTSGLDALVIEDKIFEK